MAFSKLEWQRRQRREFKRTHGYSTSAHYGTGGMREKVLLRDSHSCVRCGMTDVQHRTEFKRPITIDHKDKNRKHNTLDNLQTLCLRCHGNKDISRQLTIRRIPLHREDILRRRSAGQSYQQIADELGFSIAAIWKWVRKWSAN